VKEWYGGVFFLLPQRSKIPREVDLTPKAPTSNCHIYLIVGVFLQAWARAFVLPARARLAAALGPADAWPSHDIVSL